MSGSAFSVSALYPDAAFRITKGEPVIGGLRGGTRHYFCDYCMSWLLTRPEGMDNFVNVRATLLDNPEDFAPFIETCTREKLSWALTGAAFSYHQFPDQAEFPHLLQTYAAHRKRITEG